jgi:hypothetical protein
MVYGYIRVSTEEQNLENQRKAILERFKVDEWVEEKRSGTVGWEKRSPERPLRRFFCFATDTTMLQPTLYMRICFP